MPITTRTTRAKAKNAAPAKASAQSKKASGPNHIGNSEKENDYQNYVDKQVNYFRDIDSFSLSVDTPTKYKPQSKIKKEDEELIQEEYPFLGPQPVNITTKAPPPPSPSEDADLDELLNFYSTGNLTSVLTKIDNKMY